MNKITLHGMKINGGSAEGEALVTRSPLGGFGCFNFSNGELIDLNHEWYDGVKQFVHSQLLFLSG
jgi:predicted aconitase with swiveling domain